MAAPVRMDPFRTIINVHWKEPPSEPISEPPPSEPPPSEPPSEPSFAVTTEYFMAATGSYDYDSWGYNNLASTIDFGSGVYLPVEGSVVSGDYTDVPEGSLTLYAMYAVMMTAKYDPFSHPDDGTEFNLLFSGSLVSYLNGKEVWINGVHEFTIDNSDPHQSLFSSGGRTRWSINNNSGGEFPPSQDWVYDLSSGGPFYLEIRAP